MRVLIADDDRTTTAILARTLRRWHLEVTEAHDGVQAWELLRDGTGPSMAIVDWMMPGIDGLELCRRIRKTDALATMHVILLTARDGHTDVVAGLEAGADDYIVKPFDLDELHARVHVGIRVVTLQEHVTAQMAALNAARDDLARLASTDALTDLASRRRWFELAVNEFGRYRRYRRPFAVLMIDLDFFKRVNDSFGHGAGDEVLKRFAEALRSQCRNSDVVGRLGGEEFAVLLPETPPAVAAEVAGRIVEACRSLVVGVPAGQVRFTCSVGTAAMTPADVDVEALVRRADAALYLAKRHGRNRVEASQPDLATAAAAPSS